MLKHPLILILLTVGLNAAYAQNMPGDIPDHTPMMNDTWETINTLMYRVTYKDNQTIYTPHFPDELKALDKETVELPGYLVPLHGGRDHQTFMLSVLPVMQCMFCGTNDIPPMVEVFVKKGKSVRFTEDPITIRGRVHLNANIEEGNSEIQIFDAEVVK